MSEYKENKMGTMAIKPLVVSMSFPIMISMLVQALYNIVDSYFIGQYDPNYGVAALTVAFPLQTLMIAFGSGTGVGFNAILSRSLGEKNPQKAGASANTGILLNLINYLIFLILSITVTSAFVHGQTSQAQTIAYAENYLHIVLGLSAGLFLQMTFERMLQATGRSHLSMISQITGALVNTILDYMMIFGHGPFPKMGVAGAAYATVIGQFVAAAVGLSLNLYFCHEFRLSLVRVFRPQAAMVREIYYVGIPTVAMMAVGSVMSWGMNLILGHAAGDNGLTIFGIYFKLQSFFFMPVFGLNNGIIPILAYNYGARRKNRIKQTLRFGIMLAAVIMVTGTLVFWIFPNGLLKLFNASPQVTAMGIVALRIISIHFPLAAVGILFGGIFQAFAKSTYSLVVSLGRQMFVLLPVAWFLSLFGNVNIIWFCFIIAEGVSLALSIIFYRKVRCEMIEPLRE